MKTFLLLWLLASAITMIVRDKESVDKDVKYFAISILIGFLVAIPLMILYWLYLASTILGSGVWVLALGLLIFGAFKLLFLVLGFGGGSSSISNDDSSGKSNSSTSTLYHAQVFRHGQWINLGGYYHLSSAYDQAERYAGKGERTRVVDSNGRVQ